MGNELEIEKLIPEVDIRHTLRDHWLGEHRTRDIAAITANIYHDLVAGNDAANEEAKEMLLVLAFEVERLQSTIQYLMDGMEIVHERTGNTLTMAKVLYGVKHGNTNPAE